MAVTTQQLINRKNLADGTFNKLVADSTKIKTRYTTEKGNTYDVYRDKDGKYFIVDKNNKVSYFTNKDAIALFDNNVATTTSKATYAKDLADYMREQSEKNNTKVTSGNVNSYTPANLGTTSSTKSAEQKEIADLKATIEEFMKPRSADELADLHEIDIDEQSWLDTYNNRTNDFYDAAAATQEELRAQSARNNAQYMHRLTDAYLDSYKNAAPTATGKGALAANALSNLISASDTMSYNDIGMQQSVNALEEERKKELANNAYLAKDYINNARSYLSTLSANLNTADVKAGVAKLDKYATEYAANRATQAARAQAAATKYSGLASAAATNASALASNYGNLNNWEQLYNYYLTTRGSASAADKAIANLYSPTTK